MTNSVVILGSTGSIGMNTLDVVSRHPKMFRVRGLSAHRNVSKMYEQCVRYQPEQAVMVDADAAGRLRKKLKQSGMDIEVGCGEEDVCAMAQDSGETVVCGIVGAAGLMPTVAAVEAGKKVLIANKEPLVMLGNYIIDLARKHNARLLPLDSEHNAIFQCLPGGNSNGRNGAANVYDSNDVKRIILTGSGGPFRSMPMDLFATVTPGQACAHPNWEMGPKISVDSATMMNKGLEIIETCVLFSVPVEKVAVLIHPQSVIHSMVEYIDGSVIAQMGSPDMRIPIANALAWPERIESGAKSLDFIELTQFNFEPPDFERFPALALAKQAAETGGTLPAIMNAANEIAVSAFLDERISFDMIAKIVEKTMASVEVYDVNNIDNVLSADSRARSVSQNLIGR